jgi:hypothetical protein
MEKNFRKLKEDVLNNNPIQKKLSPFLHKSHGLEDLNEYLQPIFHI